MSGWEILIRMSESILITGASGFLGFNSALALASEPWTDNIYCLVRLDSLLPGTLSHPKIKILFGDLKSAEIPFNNGIVLHCAAVRNSSSPILWETNVDNTARLARQAAAHNCRFIYASSQSVYGNPRKTPVDEYADTQPFDEYGRSKLAGEHAVRDAYQGSPSNWIALRLSRLYGRASISRYEGALGTFLKAAMEGRKVTISGTGSFTMDLLHIRDACEAVKSACKESRRLNGAYNIGSSIPVTILDLVTALKGLYPDFEWEFDNLQSERSGLWLDISRFQNAVGWSPIEKLKDNLTDALD